MKLGAVVIMAVLSGCGVTPAPQVKYVPVPSSLTAPIPLPTVPGPKRATQRDVAKYLIDLHLAADRLETELEAIRQWSDSIAKQSTK